MLKERAAARQRNIERRRALGKGGVIDPDVGKVKASGRPQGRGRAYTGTRKPVEAPCLRRDPTAVTKLAILARWEKRAEAEGCKVAHLPFRVKTELENEWHWGRDCIARWVKIKPKLMQAVARLRLGKKGLRPFGSRARTSYQNHNKAMGARIRETRTGISSKQSPLEGVMARLKKWFDEERAHGHEVRNSTINTRLKFELEYEVDKQLVLQEHKSENFCAHALRASQRRLTKFAITCPSKQQEWWCDHYVYPRIGATARTGQKLSEQHNRKDLYEKHQLTWATSDRFIHLVARGTSDELLTHISRPEEFIEHRHETAVIVVDATAMWLKLRGEDKARMVPFFSMPFRSILCHSRSGSVSFRAGRSSCHGTWTGFRVIPSVPKPCHPISRVIMDRGHTR